MNDNNLDFASAVPDVYGHVFDMPGERDVHHPGSHFQIPDVQLFEAFGQTRVVKIHTVR